MTNLTDYRAEQQPDLKPCPFCGRIPTLSKYKSGYTIDHVCTFVDPTWFPTKEQAVSTWNARWRAE